MFKLVYASDYTEYTAGTYPSMDACVKDCETRYGVTRFGMDDDGTLYSIVYADGIVVLKVYETDEARR